MCRDARKKTTDKKVYNKQFPCSASCTEASRLYSPGEQPPGDCWEDVGVVAREHRFSDDEVDKGVCIPRERSPKDLEDAALSLDEQERFDVDASDTNDALDPIGRRLPEADFNIVVGGTCYCLDLFLPAAYTIMLSYLILLEDGNRIYFLQKR